jgi:hypothetical protein
MEYQCRSRSGSQLHVHPDPAANAAHQPHHAGGVAARRHEIDQVDRVVRRLEPV